MPFLLLGGHEFSASAISEMNGKLDGELERFARRALEVEFPYLILDARYEKVREEGVIRSRAVLVVIGIDWEGRRQILGSPTRRPPYSLPPPRPWRSPIAKAPRAGASCS